MILPRTIAQKCEHREIGHGIIALVERAERMQAEIGHAARLEVRRRADFDRNRLGQQGLDR